ncbi:hypothetical protein ACJJIE_09110 [Microbulbifer sp. TRSA001]|uniref:hypothetical protein n=1 Tax=Microbulbifer sp. TRSA001 TaxID=3243381 RepID=UPI0040397BE9
MSSSTTGLRQNVKRAGIFSLDITAFAVMSNNYHIVLYIDSNTGKTWFDTEVIHLVRAF